MQVFVMLSALVVGALARPGYLHAPLLAAPVEISSQFHAQDTLGQYSYGYAAPLSAKSESRSVDGVTRGGYTYVDAEGKVQSVQYTADAAHGFRVAASNLPVGPEPTHQDAPKPVEDTAEVAKAKADHLAAVEEAKAREASSAADDLASTDGAEDGSDSAAQAVTAVPASTVSIGAPVVAGIVSQPVSYYTYSAVAPAYHYAAVAPAVPAVQTLGYTPLVYNGVQLEDVNVARARAEHAVAHLEAKARIIASGGIVH